MNELYLAALNNDTGYIKKYLAEHPEFINQINQQFQFKSTRDHYTNGLFARKQAFFLGMIWLTTGGLVAPLLGGYSVYLTAKEMRDLARHEWLSTYNGWTLLECALYANATETACILISNGAEITPLAKKLLSEKKFKYPQMVDLILTAEKDRTNILYLEEQRTLLSKENEEARATWPEVINRFGELKQQVAKAKADEKILLSDLATLRSIQNPQTSTVCKLQEEIAKQKGRKKEYKAQLISLARLMENAGIFQKATPYIFPYGLIEYKTDYIAGNCFYDAVVALRYDLKWTQDQLRAAVSNELENNEKIYSPFMHKDPDGRIRIEIGYNPATKNSIFEKVSRTYEEYCEHMKQSRVYVDEPEIRAFTNAKKVACFIIDKLNGTTILIGSEFIKSDNPPIFLCRENNDHYFPLMCSKEKKWQEVMSEVVKGSSNKPGMQSN